MYIEIVNNSQELIAVFIIATVMSISPGSDFVMVVRNTLGFGRTAGLYSSLGIACAIWLHVLYSIAGLALIISKSVFLFSLLKYLGAAYLIYIGWKSFNSNSNLVINNEEGTNTLSNAMAFKIGFITNTLNPKTTLFFLSIFTQIVSVETSLSMQIIYGSIISFMHLSWFSGCAVFLSHPALLRRFNMYKDKIDKLVGIVLISFGAKVAMSNSN